MAQLNKHRDLLVKQRTLLIKHMVQLIDHRNYYVKQADQLAKHMVSDTHTNFINISLEEYLS